MTHQAKGRPTEYAGYLFRSSLEARWAAFFDLLSIPWRYEAIDLDGYIPDFILPDTNLLIEVKPIFKWEEALPYAEKVMQSGWTEHFVIVGAHWQLGESKDCPYDTSPIFGMYFEPNRWAYEGDPHTGNLEPRPPFHDVSTAEPMELVWCIDEGTNVTAPHPYGWNEPCGAWFSRMYRAGFDGKHWSPLSSQESLDLDARWAQAHRQIQWQPRAGRA